MKHDLVNAGQLTVAIEVGPKRRVFAQAQDWPGWCRAGKDEISALTHLLSIASRYTQVAERAGLQKAERESPRDSSGG